MGVIGYGATIECDDGASSAYVEFVEVTNITVPSVEQATIEATHLQSADRTREYISGLIEPGECGFEQHFSTSEYARAIALKGVTRSYKITSPADDDNTTIEFDGILTKTDLELTADVVTSMKHTIKVVGAVSVN